MHVLFMPYGERGCIEHLLRDMEAQKHWLICKKGEEVKKQLISGQVRCLPFGIYEYVFPREDLDAVLFTLKFDQFQDDARYTIKRKFFGIDAEKLFLKFLDAKPIPNFEKGKAYPWFIGEGVAIIPIGIREDVDIIEEKPGAVTGFTHEAI